MNKEQNLSFVKSNTGKYRKESKAKFQKQKLSSSVHSIIRTMDDDISSTTNIESIINLAQAINLDDDDTNGDGTSCDSDLE